MKPTTYSPRALRAHLKRGGLIAYATRAVFGLGCDPTSRRGLRRLVRLKRRPGHKGLIVIADRAERLSKLHQPLSETLARKARSRWPGPHTWIMPAARQVPHLLAPRGQIALRVDAHPDAVALCRNLRMPLVSTSANRSGRRPLKTTRACRQAFGRQVWVVPGRVVHRTRPSTVANLVSDQVLRT